jgi:FkbM family methyltransferase
MRNFATHNYNDKEYKFYQAKNKNSLYFSDVESYFDEFTKDVNFYSKILKEGDLVIDIGARDGDSVLPLRACVGDSGKVLAFDPNPHEFPNLVENIDLNNFKNIETYNFGIAKEDGVQDFLYSEDFYNGGIKTEQIQIGYFPDSISLTCKNWSTLPDSVRRDFHSAALIKIDTEGSDLDILEELSECIMAARPCIVTEWWATLSYTEAMGHFLRTKNYICFSKENENKLDLEYNSRCCEREHDVFFVPTEILLDSSFDCEWKQCSLTGKPYFSVPEGFKCSLLFNEN